MLPLIRKLASSSVELNSTVRNGMEQRWSHAHRRCCSWPLPNAHGNRRPRAAKMRKDTSMTVKRVLQTVGTVVLLSLVALAEIPAGTKIPVRLNTALSSGTAQSGQRWDGVVARDVKVNGD